VQATADSGARLVVRLGALLHDLAKPDAPDDHAEAGARTAARVLRRLRYPNRLLMEVTRLVGAHDFSLEHVDELFARRLLREHGDQLAFDLVTHKEADLRTKDVPAEELEALARLRKLLERERSQPHRLADLAVDGDDLLGLGFTEGPEVGRTLESLLDAVVDEPELNTRERLLERARELA
jgi:tRNA nucleotidyltransferase (CCA-adding enzyme)